MYNKFILSIPLPEHDKQLELQAMHTVQGVSGRELHGSVDSTA